MGLPTPSIDDDVPAAGAVAGDSASAGEAARAFGRASGVGGAAGAGDGAGLVVAGAASAGDGALSATGGPAVVAAAPTFFGFVDSSWRVVQLSFGCGYFLGREPEAVVGANLADLVHADDVARLFAAVGRSAQERGGTWATARFRRADGDWVPARILLSALEPTAPPPFVFVATPAHNARATAATDRIASLEYHLREIGRQLEDAGVLQAAGVADVTGIPALADLTERQREVLRRLVQGQRVSTIARAMFLSQSAVRNHLAVVYARLGVHSQAELLEVLGAMGRIGTD